MRYSVEVTTAPVADDDWSVLRHVIEVVPGTILIEDSDEPVLVVPVEADEPMRAAMFLDGLSKFLGFEVRAGSIYPEIEADFETDLADAARSSKTTDVVQALSSWVSSSAPVFEPRRDNSGHLING